MMRHNRWGARMAMSTRAHIHVAAHGAGLDRAWCGTVGHGNHGAVRRRVAAHKTSYSTGAGL
eukprot:3025555-Prymnesium_polylepis.2